MPQNFRSIFQDKSVIHISDIDLDGISCVILSKYFIENNCKSIKYICTGDRTMSEIPDDIFEYESDIFLFTDITPTIEFAKEIIARNKQLCLVDHHETANEIFSSIDMSNHKYYYTEEICTTKLLYNLIIESSSCKRENRVIKRFVDLVDTYDCWRDEHEDWENAKDLHYLKNKSVDWFGNKSGYDKNRFFINNTINKFQEDRKFFYKYDELKKIRAEREKENKNYNKAKKKLEKRIDSNGNNYIYVECPSQISVIANKLLKENNDVDYALCRSTYFKAVDDRSLSLRSSNNFDVKLIAESYGGGGHISAAGFQANDDQEYKDLISGNKHPI